jgi:phage-related protein (TIGR01555 family)
VARSDYRAAVISRFALAMAAKSINNTLILDAQEKWEQKTLTFAGWPEALDRLLLVIAGAADMPITRLLGRSPAGMNATGESDMQHWYERISALQQTRIRPVLRPLDQALVRSAIGRDPRNMSYQWRPLYTLGADEKATVADKQSMAIERLNNTGLLDRATLAQAVASQLEDDGFLPGVLPAAADPGLAPPGTTPPGNGDTPSPVAPLTLPSRNPARERDPA